MGINQIIQLWIKSWTVIFQWFENDFEKGSSESGINLNLLSIDNWISADFFGSFCAVHAATGSHPERHSGDHHSVEDFNELHGHTRENNCASGAHRKGTESGEASDWTCNRIKCEQTTKDKIFCECEDIDNNSSYASEKISCWRFHNPANSSYNAIHPSTHQKVIEYSQYLDYDCDAVKIACKFESLVNNANTASSPTRQKKFTKLRRRSWKLPDHPWLLTCRPAATKIGTASQEIVSNCRAKPDSTSAHRHWRL